MGTRASMEWWEDEFCQRLAAGTRFVIRYRVRVAWAIMAGPVALIHVVFVAVVSITAF